MNNANSFRAKNVSIIGIVFLVVGIVLLLSKLHILPFQWSFVVWGGIGLYGMGVTILAFPQQRRGAVFFGSFLFFLSVGVLLHKTQMVVSTMPWNFVATGSLALGFAFVMTYLLDIRRIGMLVPALFFGSYGVLYYLWEYDVLEWEEVLSLVRTYWPVLLILWGLSLILRRR